MQQRYSVVIAGCGDRGAWHAHGFKENSDRFDLRAVCDRHVDRAAALASRFDVRSTFSDVEEMLANERPDVFCFCTMPKVRLDLVKLGLKYNVKAIALEKPLAIELPEAREIAALCDAAGVKLVVSHQQKYGKAWRAVKEIVDRGDIGTVTEIHATARAWSGQQGTHLADYMIWFNDRSPVKWVVGQAIGTKMLDDSHPSPDYVVASLEFENGVRGVIECGAHAPHNIPGKAPIGDMDFWTDSSITIRGTHGFATVVTGGGWQAFTKTSNGTLLSGDGYFDPSHEQPLYIRDLADWLDDSTRRHSCDGSISLHGFEVINAAYLSALNRRRIDLPIKEIPFHPVLDQLRTYLPTTDEYAITR